MLVRERGPVVAIVGAAVLLAACGSSGGSPSAGRLGTGASAVAYSACMRSHGVPGFPDPGSGGQVPKADPAQLGVATSRIRTAERACADLIPSIGDTAEQQQETQCAMADDCSQAVVQKWLTGLRTLAQCLRTHGEPTWPDPVVSSRGTPHFNYEQAGIDHHAAPVLAKVQQCVDRTGFRGLPLP